jgi:polyphenol oxidase
MTALPIPIHTPALGFSHGFFTREGGVSSGSFATLNCSLSSRDSPDAVRTNRVLAGRAVGADPESLVGLTQVHGAETVRVAGPWPAGAGPQADAMASDRPGIALGIITADCAPVLLADTSAGVIGAAHAGWRGALAGVIESVVAAMAELGAKPERIVAVIGPCIAQPSYEVGAELREEALAASPDHARFFAPGRREGHWQFDLAGCCVARLISAGVGAVRALGIDTLTDESRFFSHRRRTLTGGGPIGHQISIIALPD